MRHRSIYRILARKTDIWFIDLAAADGETALARAEALWFGRRRDAFRHAAEQEPDTFTIDEIASMHLTDNIIEERLGSAEKALRTFAHDTGSAAGRDALHDLLADLGHYADSIGVDFRDELERAAETWSREKTEGGAP